MPDNLLSAVAPTGPLAGIRVVDLTINESRAACKPGWLTCTTGVVLLAYSCNVPESRSTASA
jgi:hypothetical protein